MGLRVTALGAGVNWVSVPGLKAMLGTAELMVVPPVFETVR